MSDTISVDVENYGRIRIFRAAARASSWFDTVHDPPSYNPFYRKHLRRRYASGTDGDLDDESIPGFLGPDLTSRPHDDTLSQRTPDLRNPVRLQQQDLNVSPLSVLETEGATLEDEDPGVNDLDTATTHTRLRRNNFRQNLAHGPLKKEHPHIGQQIGRIGRAVSALGYPAVKEATAHTVERSALVIDFEKDAASAKGDGISVYQCVQLINLIVDSDASETNPRLYSCSQARTILSGLSLLQHPSMKLSVHALHLRVFHVENDPRILEDIFSIFKLSSPEFNRYGTEFEKFAVDTFAQRRSGKQTWFWRPSFDKTRSVLRLAFSLEYHTPRALDSRLKASTTNEVLEKDQGSLKSRLGEMSGLSRAPEYEFYRKRMSVYIQHKRSDHLHQGRGSPVKNEDLVGSAQVHHVHADMSGSPGSQYTQDAIASENTILIVEKTTDGGNPIFQAEEQWKQLWTDSEISMSPHGGRDGTAALQLLQAIVRFSFNKIVSDWRGYIKVMDNHISLLEERIYDRPEDDSQAKELWRTSKQLLDMEKLLISQTFLIKVVQDDFINPGGLETGDKDWLKDLLTDFEELRYDIQEDLMKAVTQMVDLMYKSVSIRDARKSVELSTSLWRLSWITFIFLPLTFLVGFFGMNVDTFHNTPSIKWYFITAVPFMCFILLLWFSIKYFMDRSA